MTHVHCDYSLARMQLSALDHAEIEHLKQYCLIDGFHGEFLFLVLPDSAMPVLSEIDDEFLPVSAGAALNAVSITDDLCIPVCYKTHSMCWLIKDKLDGKQLCFQIGSETQPLVPFITNQMDKHGFIFAVFINSRSGAPKGVRVFKK